MQAQRTITTALVALVALLVTATSASAAAQFSPSDRFLVYDFVEVGQTSAPQDLTVTNTGDAPLSVNSVRIEGRDPGDFAITANSCTGTAVPAGSTCKVTIVFKPLVAGTRVASVRFGDGTPCPEWVNVAGSGTATQAGQTARAAACTSDNAPTQPSGGSTQTPEPAPVSNSQGSTSITLPSDETCLSRRPDLRVHLLASKKDPLVSVRATLGGKRLKTVKGKRTVVIVKFRGLPRGRFTLSVRARTASGKTYREVRHYVTCVGKGKPSPQS